MLSKILGDGGKFANFLKKHNVNYNSKKVQANHKLIRTCGLHTAVRLFCYQMTNAEYLTWLLSATSCMNPDSLVGMLTIIGHL